MKNKLNDATILLIISGNPEAMEKLVRFYDPYINQLARDTVRDAYGREKRFVNADRKSFLLLCIIEAVLKWRPEKG